MPSPEKSEAGYIAPEFLRIGAITAMEVKNKTYGRMGIKDGHTVLDAGCGAGLDLPTLSALVGPEGKVIGIDSDNDMLLACLDLEDEIPYANVILDRGDVCQTPYADGAFDSVRSERVMQHLEDPEAALFELVRITKDGGAIVIADTDYGSMSVDCPERALERRMRDFLLWDGVRSPWAARALPALFRSLKLVNVHEETISLCSYGQQEPENGPFRRIEDKAVKMGVVTPEELERWRRYRQNGFFSFSTVIVSGRKKFR